MYSLSKNLGGLENLSLIPGSVGASPMQNIGAYGAELSSTFLYADVIDAATGEKRRITKDDARFAYRSTIFKEHPELVIVRIALAFATEGAPNTTYVDLARAADAGVPLSTPAEIAVAVRNIRSHKFPTPKEGGTGGSFFKNPIVSTAEAAALTERFPELPTYPQKDGRVKVSLAWLLDHALSLKGYNNGYARLYEKQPLVIVAQEGAHATDVDMLASFVQERVRDAFGIAIEREVETIGA